MTCVASFAVLAAGVLIRLTPAAELTVGDGHVRLSDVAIAPPTDMGAIEIARLPAGATHRIQRAQLADLIRRAVPAAEVSGDLAGALTVHSGSAPAVSAVQSFSPEIPAVERGQKLSLMSSVGPVIIERPVVALQDASKADKRLFVRTEDGDVFAAPIATAGEK